MGCPSGVRFDNVRSCRAEDGLFDLAEIYSRLALTDAQTSYDQAIGRFPV